MKLCESSLSDGVLWEIAQVETKEKAIPMMAMLLMEFWGAVREVFEPIWELKPRQSRLLHGAGVQTLGFLMEAMVARRGSDDWPKKDYFVAQLRLIEDDCHWTQGWWEFGGDVRRRWDEVQNVNRDVMMLVNHMTRVYRLRCRKPQG